MNMSIQKLAVIVSAIATLAVLDVHAQPADASVPATSASSDAAAHKAARKADHALEKAVRKALAKDKAVDVTHVNVRARNGAVALLGSVPEQGQADAATQAAQSVTGVTSVNNALTIKSVAQ
jgi:hyperosmotically inducible periplasmic protein